MKKSDEMNKIAHCSEKKKRRAVNEAANIASSWIVRRLLRKIRRTARNGCFEYNYEIRHSLDMHEALARAVAEKLRVHGFGVSVKNTTVRTGIADGYEETIITINW
jgi:hypothetical protein